VADTGAAVTLLIEPNVVGGASIFATLEVKLISGSPPEPRLTAEERLIQATDALWATRLWVVISQAIDAKEITDPEAIGEALGLPVSVAIELLARKKWQVGDVLLLERAAKRLGLAVRAFDPWLQ
jgi:hypothetical protein